MSSMERASASACSVLSACADGAAGAATVIGLRSGALPVPAPSPSAAAAGPAAIGASAAARSAVLVAAPTILRIRRESVVVVVIDFLSRGEVGIVVPGEGARGPGEAIWCHRSVGQRRRRGAAASVLRGSISVLRGRYGSFRSGTGPRLPRVGRPRGTG